MRLRAITPPLPYELLDLLEEYGIRTDEELLFSGTPMEIYRRMIPCAVTLADLIAEIKRVSAIASAPPFYGDDLIQRAEMFYASDSPEDYSSGLPELDALLDSFGRRRILEISGDRGSGKSNLALQIVVRHLSRCPDSSALWIDTSGDFSIDRVVPILRTCNELPGVNSAAARLQLALAFNLDTLYEALDALKPQDVQENPIRLIVIDSITPIFRPLLSAVSAQGHAMMTMFMRYLRSLAESRLVSFLVINGTSAGTSSKSPSTATKATRKPALGPSFTYTTDATLWLSRSEDSGVDGTIEEGQSLHMAEVLRSKTTPSGARCIFTIQGGVLGPAKGAQQSEGM